MSGRYYIYTKHGWSDVNPETGRVSCWREKVRFVFICDGQLHVARTKAVLKGLQALAAGKPTTIREGPRVPTKSCAPRPLACSTQLTQQIPSPIKVDTGVQVQTIIEKDDLSKAREISCNSRNANSSKIIVITNNSASNSNSRPLSQQPSQKRQKIRRNSSSNSHHKPLKPISTRKRRNSSSDDNRPLPKRRNIPTNLSSSRHLKELIIDEEDIELVRNYLVNDIHNILGIDLEQFDASNWYKKNVFYNINPIVHIERSKLIDDKLKQSQDEEISLEEFVTNLGLQSVKTITTNRARYLTRQKVEQKNKANQSNIEISESSHTSSDDKENIYQKKDTKNKTGLLKQRKENRVTNTSNADSSESSNTNSGESDNNTDSSESVFLKRRLSLRKLSNNGGATPNNSKQTSPLKSNKNQVISVSNTEKNNSKQTSLFKNNKNEVISVNNTEKNNSKQTSLLKKYENQVISVSNTDKNEVLHPQKKTEITSKEDSGSDTDEVFEKRTSPRKLHLKSDKEVPNHGVSVTKKTEQSVVNRKKMSENIQKKSDDKEVTTLQMKATASQKLASKSLTENVKTGKSIGNVREGNKQPAVDKKRLSPRKMEMKKLSLGRNSHCSVANQYSSLEDHAIIAWISSGSRAERVNGNRVWRDLQSEFYNLTKTRVLRKHMSPSRRNSLLAEPTVVSAWSKRPKSAAPASTPQEPKRILRSSNANDDNTRNPTEKINEDEKSGTDNKNMSRNSGKTVTDNEKTVKDKKKNKLLPASPSYSELTRAFSSRRQATRSLSNARQSDISVSQDTDKPRTRRLYNPVNYV